MADTVYSVQDLLNPPTYDQVKEDVYLRMIAAGFTALRSYAPESLPVVMVETESQSVYQWGVAAQFQTQSGYNDLASGAALEELSHEVYADDRLPGVKAQGFLTLTDARSQGPLTFSPLSTAFSVGIGGRQYNGVVPVGTPDNVTIPLGGSAKVYVQAAEVGAGYNVGEGSINTFVRGRLTGVTVTNTTGWQSDAYGASGTDPETDPDLQQRNRTKWGTLPQYKTNTMVPSGYENMARNASPQVTRVAVLTNLDLTDPGLVSVIIVGATNPLPSDVVATVQAAISPMTTGGGYIPETARCVVSAAPVLSVVVVATIYVDPTYNTASFLQQVKDDLTTWFDGFLIGGGKLGLVSYDRIVGVMSYRAGLTQQTVIDIQNATINGGTSDLTIAYDQVPEPDLTGVVLQSL